MTDRWGAPDRHYSAVNLQKQGLSFKEQLIGEMLEKRFPNLCERVERAFRQSNLLIREHLRTETRLRLSIDEKSQSVPVRVVAGIPSVLLDALDVDLDVLDLYLQLSLLKKTVLGLERVTEKYPFLQKWPPMTGKIPPVAEITDTCNGVKNLCEELAKIKFFDKVWKIEEDILGAYFFKQCRVELYWMPIGIIAGNLGCSPESLTQVVAIHELAHAYTHVGFDIDDHAWETRDFASSSLHVIEGLAQFFTNAVCERIAGRYPETHTAYKALLEKQKGPYRAHLEWLADDEAGGEAVRSAMIHFRSHGEVRHEIFREMVEDAKHRLGRRRKNGYQDSIPTEIFG